MLCPVYLPGSRMKTLSSWVSNIFHRYKKYLKGGVDFPIIYLLKDFPIVPCIRVYNIRVVLWKHIIIIYICSIHKNPYKNVHKFRFILVAKLDIKCFSLSAFCLNISCFYSSVINKMNKKIIVKSYFISYMVCPGVRPSE